MNSFTFIYDLDVSYAKLEERNIEEFVDICKTEASSHRCLRVANC